MDWEFSPVDIQVSRPLVMLRKAMICLSLYHFWKTERYQESQIILDFDSLFDGVCPSECFCTARRITGQVRRHGKCKVSFKAYQNDLKCSTELDTCLQTVCAPNHRSAGCFCNRGQIGVARGPNSALCRSMLTQVSVAHSASITHVSNGVEKQNMELMLRWRCHLRSGFLAAHVIADPVATRMNPGVVTTWMPA